MSISQIVTVRATDRDTNSNGQVTYDFDENSFLFQIDHYSGQISLQNRLERLDAEYRLVVIASDEAVQELR